jgi:hypothetical protein
VVAELSSSVPCVTPAMLLLRRGEYPTLPDHSDFTSLAVLVLQYTQARKQHSGQIIFLNKISKKFYVLVWEWLENLQHLKGRGSYLKIIKR